MDTFDSMSISGKACFFDCRAIMTRRDATFTTAEEEWKQSNPHGRFPCPCMVLLCCLAPVGAPHDLLYRLEPAFLNHLDFSSA